MGLVMCLVMGMELGISDGDGVGDVVCDGDGVGVGYGDWVGHGVGDGG